MKRSGLNENSSAGQNSSLLQLQKGKTYNQTNLKTEKEAVKEIAPEMKDSPSQAQAKSFFNCKFNHNHRSGQLQDSENMESPMMGCIICKAQIQIGEKFI